MNKYLKLQSILKKYNKLIIAFSGGVDSSFLLKVATSVLPLDNIKAVTFSSNVFSEKELADAALLAKSLNVSHEFFKIEHLSFLAHNPENRCYLCKKAIYSKLKEYSLTSGFNIIADGSNADDVNTYRPGRKAASEEGIVSPLEDAGMTKNEIRLLSEELGLDTYNKPARPCYLTRFPHNFDITADMIKHIDRIENYLKDNEFSIIRARHIDSDTVCIVTDVNEFGNIVIKREGIVTMCRKEGYSKVTLDLDGYIAK